MKRFFLTSLLLCAVACVGCMHQPTGTTPATAPAVLTPYQKAAIIMDSAAGEVQIAQTALINLHKAGKVPDDQYRSIQNIFQLVGNYGIQIDKLLASEASSQTITALVTNAINGFVGISTTGLDAQTASQITSYSQIVVSLLQQLLPLFPPAVTATGNSPYLEVTPWIPQPSQPLRSPPNSSSSAASTLTVSIRPLPRLLALPSNRFPTSSLTQTPSGSRS